MAVFTDAKVLLRVRLLLIDRLDAVEVGAAGQATDFLRARLGQCVFYMLDHVMAPINDRLTPKEIEDELAKAGAKEIRRLTRGTDFDRIEAIYQKKPYAKEHFGVGENRHVFTK